MPLTVRAAVATDAAAIRALLAHEIQTGYAHFGADAPTLGDLEAAIVTPSPLPFLVAEVDGAFGGFLRATPWKDRAAYAWSVEVGAYVAPGVRHRGVGRALLDDALHQLRARGYRRVIAGIALPNPPSVAVAEGAGFVKVAEFPDIGFKAGAWRSVGYWQLALGGDEPPDGLPSLR